MSYLALATVGLAFLILFLAVLRARSNTIVYAMYAILLHICYGVCHCTFVFLKTALGQNNAFLNFSRRSRRLSFFVGYHTHCIWCRTSQPRLQQVSGGTLRLYHFDLQVQWILPRRVAWNMLKHVEACWNHVVPEMMFDLKKFCWSTSSAWDFFHLKIESSFRSFPSAVTDITDVTDVTEWGCHPLLISQHPGCRPARLAPPAPAWLPDASQRYRKARPCRAPMRAPRWQFRLWQNSLRFFLVFWNLM